MVRRAERQRPSDDAAARIKPAIAWLLWIGGGFVGLHRFYLRTSLLGFVYIALTLVVLVSSNNAYDSRVAVSGAATEIEIAEMDSDYYAGQAEQGVEGAEARLAESRARLDSAERQLATANRVQSARLTLARCPVHGHPLLLVVNAAQNQETE